MSDYGSDYFFTDKQEEKFYCVPGNEGGVFPEDELRYEVSSFFEELIARAKGSINEYDLGLQAVMCVMDDGTVIMKIAENDGIDPHATTLANMNRFYRGEKGYYKATPIDASPVYGQDIISPPVYIRILDNLDTFLLAGHTRSHDPLDSYKAKVIKVIAEEAKKISDRKCYESYQFGLRDDEFSPTSDKELDDNNYQELISYLNDKIDKDFNK